MRARWRWHMWPNCWTSYCPIEKPMMRFSGWRFRCCSAAGSEVWMPVTYFELWMTRLMGYLPELSECMVCGSELNGSRAFFHALADGLMCVDDKRLASSEMSTESRKAWRRKCFVLPWRV